MKSQCEMCKEMSQCPVCENGMRICLRCRVKYGVLTRKQRWREVRVRQARLADAYRREEK